jgi:diguanylate cyclase (GGDEF)-like protein
MQSPIRTAPGKSRLIDWHHRHTRDALVLLATGTATFALAHFYDLPPQLLQFGLDYADWEMDDLIFVVFMLSVGLMIYGFRRYQDLSREIDARTAAESEARMMARHDPLTGLPNRRFFEERLTDYLHATSATSQLAVLMLDLDGFKPVNDSHGHAVGDKALIEFARRVSGMCRTNVFLARIGGDEFAILMPALASLDEPAVLARRIAATFADPFIVNNATVNFGVGVGIAVAPNDGDGADDLMRRADRAMYRAKEAGRSSVRFFEPEMDSAIERRALIESALRIAIESDQIIPYFQPLVSLDANQIIGFEALARWESESLGSVPPDVFIRIAEENGLIDALGDRLFRRACCEAKNWPAGFVLAFNISPVQLRDPTLGLRILSILGQSGLSPRQLEIEITETALVGNIAIAQTTIDHLRQAGVRIALDDFGTGYATLSQLLSFHLDKIKIDRSFVSGLEKSEEGRVIVRAILGLANGFGLTTTAEGIEDTTQLTYLKANGCSEGQGYLFGKAIPAEDIPMLLKPSPSDRAVAWREGPSIEAA